MGKLRAHLRHTHTRSHKLGGNGHFRHFYILARGNKMYRLRKSTLLLSELFSIHTADSSNDSRANECCLLLFICAFSHRNTVHSIKKKPKVECEQLPFPNDFSTNFTCTRQYLIDPLIEFS